MVSVARAVSYIIQGYICCDGKRVVDLELEKLLKGFADRARGGILNVYDATYQTKYRIGNH